MKLSPFSNHRKTLWQTDDIDADCATSARPGSSRAHLLTAHCLRFRRLSLPTSRSWTRTTERAIDCALVRMYW